MLGPPDPSVLTLTLTFLLLFKQHQGQECPDVPAYMNGLSGMPLRLSPPLLNTQRNVYSYQWKVKLPFSPDYCVILTWKNKRLHSEPSILDHFNNRLNYTFQNMDLLITASEPQDSGLYVLVITFDETGHVCEIKFNVSVFDHVKKPHIQEEWKALGKGICQMTLSCLVIMDEHVNYTWYRGSELLQVGRNLTYVEQRSDTDGMNTYTCNISNRASWASHTLNITQGCPSAHQGSKFLPFLVAIVILTMLFLGTLTFFCVWRRKRRQSSETSPKEFLTIYEDVKDLQIRRNQEQEQEQKPPEGSTIYSMIQAQTPASASSETSNTLYSLVYKSGPKVKNHNSSISHSVYEEVGKRPPKAQSPTRLSREELESFDIYS